MFHLFKERGFFMQSNRRLLAFFVTLFLCATMIGHGIAFAEKANISKHKTNIVDDRDGAFEKGCDSPPCQYWWGDWIGHDNHMFYTYAVASSDGSYADGSYGKWNLNIEDSGNYEVFAFIPSNHATSQKAKYKIWHGEHYGADYKTINQSKFFDEWVSLGTYFFEGGEAAIKLEDETGESYYEVGRKLGYDAIKLIYADAANEEPQYVSGSVSPDRGESGSWFTFRTKWDDPDGDHVVDVKVRYRKMGRYAWEEKVLGFDCCSPPVFEGAFPISGSAGTYEYEFRAKDAETESASRIHTTDWFYGGEFEIIENNEAPTVELTKCPSGTLNGTSFTFEWSGRDSDGSIEEFKYELDDHTPDSSTTRNSKTYYSLDEGNHTFYVKAIDNDGEASAVDFCQFEVVISNQNQNPTVQIQNCPYLPITNSFATFRWDGNDPDGSIAKYHFNLDGDSFQSTYGTTQSFSGLSDGSHTFLVKAEDNDGGMSMVDSCSFQVQTGDSEPDPEPADLSLSRTTWIAPAEGGSLRVYVANEGDENLNWRTSASSGLSLSPSNGAINGGDNQGVRVSIPKNNSSDSKNYQVKFYNTQDYNDDSYLRISQSGSEMDDCGLSINSVNPRYLEEGQSNINLEINGSGFHPNSEVFIPGVMLGNIQTISDNRIVAEIINTYESGENVPEGYRPITIKNSQECLLVVQNNLLFVQENHTDYPKPPPQAYGEEWIPYADGFDYPVFGEYNGLSNWHLGEGTPCLELNANDQCIRYDEHYGTDFLDLDYYYSGSFHPGEDWNCGNGAHDQGAPVYAVANGKIVQFGQLVNNENMQAVLVEHKKIMANGQIEFFWSQYAHLSPAGIQCEVGDYVYRGEKIGEIGDYPDSLGDHLHFEMRRNNISVGNWPAGISRDQIENMGYLNPTDETTSSGTTSDQEGFIDNNRPDPDYITNLMEIYSGRNGQPAIIDFGEAPGEDFQSNVRNRFYVEKRLSFIYILMSALEQRSNQDIMSTARSFDDYDENDERRRYTDALYKANTLGILPAGSTFEPGKPITRYEALKFTVEAYEYLRGSIDPADAGIVVRKEASYDYNESIIQKGHAIGLTQGILHPDAFGGEMVFVADRWLPRGDTVLLVENLVQLLNPSYIPPERYIDLEADQGEIEEGQVIQQEVTIREDLVASIWRVVWPGSDIDLSISTPSGEIISPQSPSVKEVYDGATEEYYVINNPEKGIWNVDIIGVEIDPGGEPYEFSVQGIPASNGDGEQSGKIKLLAPNPQDPLYNNTVDGAYRASQNMKIMWIDDDGNSDADVDSIDLLYSIGGGNWETITTNQPADAYYWSMPADFIHEDVRVKVVAHYEAGYSAEAVSDPFRVVNGAKPTVTILNPEGGDYYVGEPLTIKWEAIGPEGFEIERVDIYSYVNGSKDGLIVRQGGDYANADSYTWYPADSDRTDSGQIGLRVWATNDTYIDEVSQNPFAIKPRPIPDSPWNEAERPFQRSEPENEDINYPEVVVDSDGNIHAAAVSIFRDSQWQNNYSSLLRFEEIQVVYRKKEGENWLTQEQVTDYPRMSDTGASLFCYWIPDVALAVDQNGNPHILFEYVPPEYADEGISDIYYAKKEKDGWRVENLSNSYGVKSLHPQIVSDENSDIFAFWYEGDEKRIHYRIKKFGNNHWDATQSVPGVARDAFDVAVDDNNVIHLAGRYDENGVQKLKYVQMKDGSWSSPELVSTPSFIYHLSLNTDAGINLAKGREALTLHSRTSEGWGSKNYDFPGVDIGDGDFYLISDPAPNLHVVYRAKVGNQERMVTRVFNGETWSDQQQISSIRAFDGYAADSNGVIGAVAWESRYNDGDDIFLSTTRFPMPLPDISLEAKVSSADPFRVNFTVQSQSGLSDLEYTFSFGNGDNVAVDTPETVFNYPESGTYTVSVIAKDGEGRTAASSTMVTVGPTVQSILVANPESLNVSPDDNLTEIEIINQGTGRMEWIAQADDAEWLSIVSLDTGVDNGRIVVRHAENEGEGRSANILISAEGAENSPLSVTIHQEAADVPPKDEDNDGLPDDWEIANGLDPTDPMDIWEDSDGDGVTNQEEFRNGTHPNQKDNFTIQGNVLYSGSETGEIRIAAFAASDATFETPVSEQWHTLNSGATETSFALKVPDGEYILHGFLDANANALQDGDEPSGQYNDPTILVSGADDAEDRTFTLQTGNGGTSDAELVAHYPFDEDFQDHSGESRHPEPVGSPELARNRCPENSALHVGEGSYLRVPAEKRFVPGADSFSIALWVRVDEMHNIEKARFLTLQHGDFSNGIAIWPRVHAEGYPFVRVMMDDTEGHRQYLNSDEIELGEWTHVAVVIHQENETKTLYMNGRPVEETPLIPGNMTPTRDMLIGAYDYDRPGNPASIVSDDVWMDDLRIYRGALAAAEIAEIASPCTEPPVGDNTVSLLAGKTDLKTKDYFTVDVEIEGEDVYAAHVEVFANPEAFEIKPDSGNYLKDFFSGTDRFEIGIMRDYEAGKWIGALGMRFPAEPVTGKGLFARNIGLRVKPNVYGPQTISGSVTLTNADGEELGVKVLDANVTIDDGLHGGEGVISGTVTLPDGSPLAGVDVTISKGRKTYTVQTDENGVFRFEDLGALETGESYVVSTEYDGFSVEQEVDDVSAPTELAFKLIDTLLADLNKDGVVDIQDFTILASAYLTDKGDEGFDERADLTRDQSVDVSDLALLGSHWIVK
jgi:hypothetical protein